MFRVMPLIVALAFPLPAYAWPGTMLDVHDGDTMTVAPMGDVRVPINIRLYGIDAPELEQRGGPQSRDHLRALVQTGQGVEVIKMSTDKYGRTVALVATDRVLMPTCWKRGRRGRIRPSATLLSAKAGRSWSRTPKKRGGACGPERTRPRRGSGGRSGNEESPRMF